MAAAAPSNISYFAFDFHEKCKRASMHNVGLLLVSYTTLIPLLTGPP
jgi:hypothetical protein